MDECHTLQGWKEPNQAQLALVLKQAEVAILWPWVPISTCTN